MKKWDLAGWGFVTLSESWVKESTSKDTTLFVLNDNSASLLFYKAKGAKSAGDMKSYLQKRAREMEIPTFYRTVSPSHLENVNADNGGFVQGTILVKDNKNEVVLIDTVQADSTLSDSLLVGAELEQNAADSLDQEAVELDQGTESKEKNVQYIVIAGMQNSKGVFVFEAKTQNLDDVPMSISRTQRYWMLR